MTFPARLPPHRPDSIDRAETGTAGAALSKLQVRRLILVALNAHRSQARLGLCDSSFDEFRHAAAWETCGVASFRALQQKHYPALLARLQELAGNERAAEHTAGRIAGDGHRRALASLRLECATIADAWGGDPSAAWSYAQRCSIAINHAPLAQASERGVWRALFTVRRRAGQLRRKKAPESPARPVCSDAPADTPAAGKGPSRAFAGGTLGVSAGGSDGASLLSGLLVGWSVFSIGWCLFDRSVVGMTGWFLVIILTVALERE